MFDVAGSWGRVNGGDVLAGNLVDLFEHRIYGNAIAARHVENFTRNAGRGARQ